MQIGTGIEEKTAAVAHERKFASSRENVKAQGTVNVFASSLFRDVD